MAELDEGRILGSYRIVRCIGQGGMGTVYEVEHLELGVHYALKTFTFDSTNEANRALKTKFLEEGKVLARLKHPNIAHVFDLAFDEETQMPYFVMDLVTYEDGESYTAEDVDPNDIDEEVVYGWFKDLASALDYIHEEGIVHRDIKPGNLLMDKDAHVILTDFGISRIFGERLKTDVDATKTMVSKTGRGKLIVGTEKYMAPEVAHGEDATTEADAYSLGVMLLRWLTGFFYCDNPGALGLLATKKYHWLPVIARLLAPTPDRRPKIYSELIKQLKPLAGAQAKDKSQDQEKKTKKKVKRHDWLHAFFIASFVLALICGAGWLGYQGWLKYEADRKANAAQLAAIQQRMDKEAAEAKEAEEKAEADAQKKAAEAKRIAEEEAKRESERKAALVKQHQDEENAREKIAKNVNAAVRKTPDVKPASSTPEKKREFVQESVAAAVQNYGPIPDKKYTWLRNGNVDAPQKQTFLLANGAKLELMPQKAATFYMMNEENLKGWHKVVLTRPFWMTRTCVTVDQWREFSPNDCEDCREVEKALNGKAHLYIRLSRKGIDEFCAYLTAKYAKQLPKGYVFRLPSAAEMSYVQDFDEVFAAYQKPNAGWMGAVYAGGLQFREKFASLRKGKATLRAFSDTGKNKNGCYQVGGLASPVPTSGILDLYGGDRPLLDQRFWGTNANYADEEIDPLRWQKNDQFVFIRLNEYDRGWRRLEERFLTHLVLGPDLVAEKAWENKRENIEMKADVPRQAKKFDPKKIPNKISKPREITLKRVGGKEMIFCEIPTGKFDMSNIDGQSKLYHRVELTKPFWMSKFLVTADEWREYAPNDFNSRAIKTAEHLFPKNPICVPNTYRRWEAYCKFLTKRYEKVLPEGYVFRLPTEAEWEWAFIADEKGDIRSLGDIRQAANEYCNLDSRLCDEFARKYQAKILQQKLAFKASGFIGDALVGGRTRRTGFGISDICVEETHQVFVLDTFDIQEPEENRNVTSCVSYENREIDPVRYAGTVANLLMFRHLGSRRHFWPIRCCGCAHIVIAPDILKPLKEKEVAPFPKEDFGGVFLGDRVTRVDQSSKYEEWRNTNERFQRMVSCENVLTAKFDKGEDTRGFHTRHEDEPWILLDLGKKCEITGLAIDGFDLGTRHLFVKVSDDGKHETLVDKEELMRKRYRIDLRKKNVKGRYIRIGREPRLEKNWFFLDKIVIYGKEK